MNYTYDTTIEDLVEGVGLDVEIEYKTYPGEWRRYKEVGYFYYYCVL
jgi:hypothetical protein